MFQKVAIRIKICKFSHPFSGKQHQHFFKNIFWCAPFGYLYFLNNNEPALGVGINPGMALTPLPSSIVWFRARLFLGITRLLL